MKYRIKHLFSDVYKVTSFDNDNDFIRFANKIKVENEDFEIGIFTVLDAISYIKKYCANLYFEIK